MTGQALLVVVDGLRPDYVKPALMPNLCAFRDRGVVAANHHAVFPSQTRVQSASVATGCFPDRHGLVNNALYLPDERRVVDTGDAEALLAVDRSTDGGLVTAPSLGEILESRGESLFAAGSCTTGANLLLNHERAGMGVCNARGFVAPEGRVSRAADPFPELARPNVAQNRWAVDACLEGALGEAPPEVSALWLSDPDLTTHEYGVGHPRVLEAVQRVDDELGRLFEALGDRSVLVVADHGLSTDDGDLDVAGAVAEAGFEDRATVVGNSGIYLDERELREPIVRVLQGTPGVGAIFTRRDGSAGRSGSIPGTVPLDGVHLDHSRAADIVVAADWSDRPNAHGYPGTTSRSGTAGHGTLSPYEMCVELIAAGPDLKGGGRRSTVPTGHVDIAPTLLALRGISAPDSMDGRVLRELLADGPDPESASTSADTVETSAPEGIGYAATLERAHAEGVTYPAVARVDRDAG